MRLDHGSLLVSDVRRAVRFFTDALGLEEVPRPSTFDTPGAWLQVGDQQIHLVGEGEPGRAAAMHPPYAREEIVIGYGSHLALVVDDLDAALARAAEHGVVPPGEAIARGDGRPGGRPAGGDERARGRSAADVRHRSRRARDRADGVRGRRHR